MATITIKNLCAKTIIGIYDWEREAKQEVLINAMIEYNAARAIQSDQIDDALDYKTIAKEIIAAVEESQFFLLEKLADHVLQLIMNHPQVEKATVEVDKPGALRHAESVSVTLSRQR